ncbi:hypothetical protein DFH05DRAFT_1529603 [Lentinula detonsa]|uniref:Uncharacterized protein n=1 Tax=Lentinula detonsa TaxID=2804962 RepID=A0A9W8TU27_9AGAR|nr:hypothetical protein DFH05DRAFT_1529603 [Lentinula detonsa]
MDSFAALHSSAPSTDDPRNKRVLFGLVCSPPPANIIHTIPAENESKTDSFSALHPPTLPMNVPAAPTHSPDSKRVRPGLVCPTSIDRSPTFPTAVRYTHWPPTHYGPPTHFPGSKRVRSGLSWPRSTPSKANESGIDSLAPHVTPICHPPSRLTANDTHPLTRQQTGPFWARLMRFNLALPPSATHPVARHQTSPFWTCLAMLYTQRPPPSCPTANESGIDSFAAIPPRATPIYHPPSRPTAFPPRVRPICHPPNRPTANESIPDSFAAIQPCVTPVYHPPSFPTPNEYVLDSFGCALHPLAAIHSRVRTRFQFGFPLLICN